MQWFRLLVAVLALSMLAIAPASAQRLNSPIVVASTYAMAHAAQTGTTNYGVTAQTVDLTGNGYDDMFAIYALVGEFGLPVGEYLAYFAGGPGGFTPVTRIDLPGRASEITEYVDGTMTVVSNTPNGPVTWRFTATPAGLSQLP
ncbi:MAG: hypothetical protein AAF414_16570 [Pseudomonadota bacterium]